nr:157_t:CDS:2 [Entrophospora candida]
MAEAVFKHTVKQKGLESKFIVDSCGTNVWREPPNPKSVEVCRKHNIDINHRSRKISKEDFDKFDYVLCMDDMNLLDAERLKPEASKLIVKFGEYDPQGEKVIRDPYFGDIKDYETSFGQTSVSSNNNNVINSLEFLSKLSNDISWLLHNSDDCDVLIQVGEEPNSKRFPCHIAILRARSSYFRRTLSKDCEEDEETLVRLLTLGGELMLDQYSEKPASIFRSEGFISLEELLASLLRRDDIGMEEIEIWNYIIRWGIANTLGIHLKPGSIPNSIALPLRDQETLLLQLLPKVAYDFRLLVRGSNDGFDASTFHARCDRKEATVVFIRIENSGEMISGYNSAYWRTSAIYIQSDKSFLFSLGDGKKLQNAILSRIRDSSNAMTVMLPTAHILVPVI